MEMNKVVVFSLAVLSAAGCAESVTSPLADPGEPLFFASHGSILTPNVSGSASGDDVTISWTWSDPEDSWDLVSFTVKRDGVTVPVSIPNSKPYTAPAVLSRNVVDADRPAGTYEYCVEVMAKYSDVIPALTHHSRSCVNVTVSGADVFTHLVSDALSSGTAISALPVNANRWDVVFALVRNGNPMSCTSAPAQLANVAVTGVVTGGAALTFHGTVGCSSDDPTQWKVQVNNPSAGTATTGTFTFSLTWAGTGYTTANSPQAWATTLPNANPNGGPTSKLR
jgi:hypothetical protein